ncbi:Meiotic Sister-Chromatid recombination aldehyde dehydrogenase [Malassezia cuniculi]|uniref:Meiotic Sister-Chromatid recombination aldehyde dehydrogenase n=1 Tax=Malassezia cuniculi TaxID=948313 RepID=A0AAF0EQY8_9BASI|nr:Meiotic Sister-Chromatid recombination aldehyde dehydrogenase [Malassezia cuniculi]
MNAFVDSIAFPYALAGAIVVTTTLVCASVYATVSAREAPARLSLRQPEQAKPGWSGEFRTDSRLFVEGKVRCVDPATGYVIDELPVDVPTTIADKIAAAEGAQVAFAKSSWTTRRRLLRTMHRWLLDDMEGLARVACRDTGKTIVDAAFGELLTTAAKLQWTIANGERVLRAETRPGNILLAHKQCRVVHEPLGVVAACVSWNYPVHNMLGPVISALFAGNAVIVKCSEHVAWTSNHILARVRQCLAACDLSPELVQLVVCAPEHAEALTRDPRIAHITFIGSDVVGRRVAHAAADELTPTTLELGGKDPAVILPGTNIAFFTSMFLRACFQGMGQNCIGIERFIVSRGQQKALINAIQPRIEALQCGSFLDDTRFGRGGSGADVARVDCGAMITDARFDALEKLIADAVARGASLICGGRRLAHERWPKGCYFAPTILADVTADMPIAQEEVFGPIFLIMAYDTEAEAIAIANSTRFGLGASVFGPRRDRCRAVSRALKCGMVNINDFGVSYLNQALPFGGVKHSGYGRFAGPEGLLGMTRPKAVTEDRLFGVVQTSIPPAVDYPLDATRAWRFLAGLMRFAFGSGTERVTGITGLALASM